MIISDMDLHMHLTDVFISDPQCVLSVCAFLGNQTCDHSVVSAMLYQLSLYLK